MEREDVYRKIGLVLDAKKKHLDEYAKDIQNLADMKSEMVFQTGGCGECENFDRQIVELEKQLK